MFSRLLQASVRGAAQRLAAATRLVGLSPNSLTLFGLALAAGAAALAALDYQLWAGVVLLLAGAFDILDGAVARESGRVHPFGAFLDSTADRYGEGVLYAGLVYLFLAHLHQEVPVFLIVASLFGSLLVSYVRARAQSLGYSCDVGWFARPERVVITALGLMLGLMVPALWILAVATNLTALQRIHAVYRQYRGTRDAEAPAAPGEGAQGPSASPRRHRGAAPSPP